MIRVLVVDDDKLVRKGLISAMPWEDFGMRVIGEAANGDKALEFLEAEEADLLLTDLAMPVMSGIELMRIVRKRHPHMHIVVLTLHRDFEYIQEALRLGAIDYIAKVQLEKERFEEVLGRIKERIGERSAGGAPETGRSGSGMYTSDSGYAFLSLLEEPDSEWIKALPMPPGAGWDEVESGLWLWAAAEEPDMADLTETLQTETHLEPGWGAIRLSGLSGLHPKEAYRRLREYRDREFFYRYDPSGPFGSLSVKAWEHPAEARSEESIGLMKSRWSSHEWIHQDSMFKEFIGDLKRLRLPKAKLIGLLYSLADEWNRLFYPVGLPNIEPGTSYDYWYQVEAWFEHTRDSIRRSIDKPSFSKEVVASIMNAVRFLQEGAERQMTAADVARQVNMSRSYFSQCFKEIVGKTFNEYLRSVRMEKAKEYLIYTNKTIQWIAEHTGYSDEKYFSRSFREHTGLLPSEYRHTNRGREMSGG